MRSELLYGLLNRALEEEIGLAVECNNPHRLTAVLHGYIRAMPKYGELMICVPSITEHVFITKRSVELDEVTL